jgi:hypothetical protein
MKATNKAAPLFHFDNILSKIRTEEKPWLTFVFRLLINSGHRLRTRFALARAAKGEGMATAGECLTRRNMNTITARMIVLMFAAGITIIVRDRQVENRAAGFSR